MLSVRPARLAVVALLLMSLIWGYNWVVMKQVIRYVDPFDFSAIRTLLAAVALFTVVISCSCSVCCRRRRLLR